MKTLQFHTSFPKKSSSSSESKKLGTKAGLSLLFFSSWNFNFWVFRNFFLNNFYCKNNGKSYGFLKMPKLENFWWKNLKNNGKFHSLENYKKPLFLAFLNFLENHTISHYFSQFGHNLFVSNAHIIPNYFSLLDLFTEGKFWQLRTFFWDLRPKSEK